MQSSDRWRAGGRQAATVRRAARLLPLLLLPAALLLPLAILGAAAWILWRSTWEEARTELTGRADAAAEHARSLIELHRLRAERVDQLLEGLTDEWIRADEPELHRRLRRMVQPDGQEPPYSIFVFDRQGRILLSSDFENAPPNDARDRDYFQVMQQPGAPPIRIGEVLLGRANGQVFFPVTLPRQRSGNGLPEGSFDGVINLSIRPATIAEDLVRLRGDPGDVLALVREDGAVLARTLPIPRPPPWRQAADAPVARLMQAGLPRFDLFGPSAVDGVERLVAYRRIEGLPLYTSVARGRSVIVGRWRERAGLLLAFGLPATLALGLLALLVRRAQHAAEAARQGLERRVAQRTADLAASEGRLRLALEAADLGTWEFDLRQGAVERTARTLAIFGLGAEFGRGHYLAWRARIHPEDRQAVSAALDAVIAGRQDRYLAEYRFQRPDGRWIWVESRARIVERGADGKALRIAGTVQDVTARREAEERRSLLAREVDHRAKNALAVVQAALRLTPRADAESYARAVEGRVSALARAHTLLAAARWTGAELREVLAGELATFLPSGGGECEPRAELQGPRMDVAPAAAQSLSLALHELATNAVKHGALSAAGGRLQVTWSPDEANGLLLLRWVERGGPTPRAELRAGFGSRLLAATVRDQLGGTLIQDWSPEGLSVEMRIPLARVRAGEAAPGQLTPAA